MSKRSMNMYDELVSVIVPVYKVESYLNECIISIVNQSYTNLEVLLIDDGSPDLCPQICDEWATKDSRITVIHKENGGLSDARNNGLDIAKGKYIMFVDSDDSIHPQMIEIMLSEIISENADVVVSDYQYVKKLPNFFEKVEYLNSYICSKETAIELSLRSITWVTAWCKLYRKELFENIYFPKERIYEDNYVSYLIYYYSNKIIKIDYPFYNYLQRGDSIIHMNELNNKIDLFDAYFERLCFLKEKKLNLAYRRQMYVIEFSLHEAYINAVKNKNKKMIKQLLRMYRKYYFVCFFSFNWKYKVIGLFNILSLKA